MTKVNFYRLSRAVQDNLRASLRGEFAPRPILIRQGRRRSVEAWLAVAGAATGLVVVLCIAGLGTIGSTLALHPSWSIVVYAALVATAAIGVLNAVACRDRMRALPYAAGVYLFPANLIDARECSLRVHPLAELTAVSAGRDSKVVLKFKRARYDFRLADAAQAQDAIRAIEETRDRMSAPLSDLDRRQVDPLAPPVMSGPFTSEIPLSRVSPPWERHRILSGALFGCVVGAAVFFGRNALSDGRLLAWARGRDDVQAYESYLAQGRRHKETVAQVLLPRAALRAAISQGSVEAIDRFVRAYPSTGIQSEITAARRAALVSEFERARAAATFEALLSFAERHPDHGLREPFDQAKHALYMRALARHRKEFADTFGDFLGRLIAVSEKLGPKKTDAGYRGPAAEIRFRRLPSKDMESADNLVRQNPMFNGPSSLPTRYLEPSRLEPHERTTAEALATSLGQPFDPEVLTFQPGQALDPSAGELPAVTVPTLVINYRVEPSGAAYAVKKPQGIFLGIVYFFTAELVLPGDAEPHRTKLTSSQRVPVALLKDGAPGPPGTLESAIYEAMSREAFAELRENYLSKSFRKQEK